jgi:hypothetical protein
MAFLNETDLHTSIYKHLLDTLIQEDANIVPFCIDAALAEARSFLIDRYDVDVIFAKVNKDRNSLLLMMCRDLAVFSIIGISNPGIDYDDKKTRAKAARTWFKQVQSGASKPNLEIKPEAEKIGVVSSGSNKKRNQHY